jgi:hypothetical protein
LSFLETVVEGAYFSLVASEFVAIDSLVFVWVVEPLNCGVAFGALQSVGTLVPAEALLKYLTVLGRILKHFRRSPKITQVVGIDASFAVMAVFLGGAPGTLVHKHVEHEPILFQIQILQIGVQIPTLQQTLRHKVIFYAFVLKVLVDVLNVIEIFEFEGNEVVWLPCLVVSYDKGSIKSVVAKQFEFICIVIPS